MRKIFIYWKGDSKKIGPLIKKLKSQKFTVEVGPSKADEKYLNDNFKFYRDCMTNKQWAFASDIWRFYKLSTNEGLYMDASVTIGPNFSKYYDSFKENNMYLIKEQSNLYASCFIYSKDKPFFKDVLNSYRKYEELELFNPRLFLISPLLLTKKINESKVSPATDNVLKIRNPKTVIKDGFNSWNGGGTSNYWNNMESKWASGKNTFSSAAKYVRVSGSYIDVYGIRDMYDISQSKEELKELKNVYKKINVIPFPSKLIWSKIYRILILKNTN